MNYTLFCNETVTDSIKLTNKLSFIYYLKFENIGKCLTLLAYTVSSRGRYNLGAVIQMTVITNSLILF